MTLTDLYDRAKRAHAVGDVDGARATLRQILGLGERVPAHRSQPGPLAPGVPMLRWGDVRRIDVVALVEGARPVAKFEDLGVAAAAKLEAELGAAGLRTVRVGPYHRRFDVALSTSVAGSLYTVIASRGPEAEAVADAERDRSPAGTRRAGLALGYPPCCVERFVSIERSDAARRDGINEAAIRAIAGIDGEIPWQLNPLSNLSPIGFTTCRADCIEALAFARRLLDALARADPAAPEVAERVLRRPILFFRYPLFWVLDGEPVPGARRARYRLPAPNDDGTGFSEGLRALADEEIGCVLGRGDDIELSDSALEVRGAGATVGRWRLVPPRVPLLLRFA